MKKLIIFSLASLFTLSLAAQPEDEKKEDEVAILIDDNSVKIEAEDLKKLSELDLNKIVQEVAEKAAKVEAQKEALLSQVEKQEQNGEITEEQADEMRAMIEERSEESMEAIGEIMEAWGEAYGEKWEKWAEEYEAKMEDWEAEMEARAEAGEATVPPLPVLPPIPGEAPAPPAPPAPPAEEGNDDEETEKSKEFIISEDGIKIRDKEEKSFKNKKSKKIRKTEGYMDINFGFNQMLANGSTIPLNGPDELNPWKSTQFELGGGAKTRLGSPYSKFYVKYGGEFSWHNFRLQGSNILSKDIQGSSVVSDSASLRGYSKSKYHIAYLNVPVMLQLDLSDVGNMDEKFNIGVGGYAGLRLTTKRELEYTDFTGTDTEETLRNNFFTSSVRYGVMAQIGFGQFKITAKYDLNPFFRDNRGPDYNMASISFGFTFI